MSQFSAQFKRIVHIYLFSLSCELFLLIEKVGPISKMVEGRQAYHTFLIYVCEIRRWRATACLFCIHVWLYPSVTTSRQILYCIERYIYAVQLEYANIYYQIGSYHYCAVSLQMSRMPAPPPAAYDSTAHCWSSHPVLKNTYLCRYCHSVILSIKALYEYKQ